MKNKFSTLTKKRTNFRMFLQGFAFCILLLSYGAPLKAQAPYCDPCVNNLDCSGFDEGTGRVAINTIDNPSMCGTVCDGYSDFTNLSTTLIPGQNYQIELENIPGSFYDMDFMVWIDWDQKGYFEESDVVLGPVAGPHVIDQITVPQNAVPGETRMRVASQSFGPPQPSYYCGDNIGFGEIEDYTISIPSQGPPDAQFFAPDTIYQGTDYVLSSAMDFADSYKWFVDGNLESENSEFTFRQDTPGVYNVMHEVTNFNNQTDTYSRDIVVIPVTAPPLPDFFANKNVITINESVRFFDISANGVSSWNWEVHPETVIDPFSGTPLPRYLPENIPDVSSPEISFLEWSPGVYDLYLEATNVEGSDDITKEEYITVAYYMNPPEATLGQAWADELSQSDDEHGYLVDHESGMSELGWEESHGDEDGEFVINGSCGEMYIVIDDLELECGEAFLRVYDGTSSDDEPLYQSCDDKGLAGFTGGGDQQCDQQDICLPPDTLFSESGNFYIEFEGSDNPEDLRGFRLHWGAEEKQPPQAYFEVPDTVCTSASIEFDNQTQGSGIVGYAWDYQAPSGFLDSTENGSFSYGVQGLYNPTLYVEDCAGNLDTFQKSIVVVDPEIPTGGVTVSENEPFIGDTVQLNANVKGCIENWEWNISPGGIEYVEGYDQHSPSPKVIFTSNGCYDVNIDVENAAGQATLGASCNVNVRGYCVPTAGQAIGDIGVKDVNVSNFNFSKSEFGQQVYYDYTAEDDHTIELEAGQTYNIQLTRQTTSNPMNRAVWIDYHGDGIVDSIDLVVYEDNAQTQSFTGSFTVPLEASGMHTRMRIGTGLGGNPLNFCGGGAVGEFLDFSVHITEGTVPPDLTLLGNNPMHIDVFNAYNELGAEAFSVDGKNISSAINIDNSEVDTANVGSYTVYYEVTDIAGNTSTTERTVVVEDNVPPEIELIGDDTIYHAVNREFDDPGVNITDNYWQDIQPSVASNLDITELGFYTKEYCATDGSGNGPVCVTRHIEVIDTLAPQIEFAAGDTLTIEAGKDFDAPEYEITDNYWPIDQIQIETGGTFSGPVELGFFTYTVTATDASGNSHTEELTIEVEDTTPPEIRFNGDRFIDLDQFQDWEDPGVSVTDNFDQSPEVITGGNYTSTDRAGTFIRTYKAVDQSGNESEQIQRIILVSSAINTNLQDELEESEVLMYPNPVRNKLTIVTDLVSGYDYEVRDVSGRLIIDGNVAAENANEFELNLSDVAAGSYMVRISVDDESVSQKMIQVQ